MESGSHAALIVLGPTTDEASGFIDALLSEGLILANHAMTLAPAPIIVIITDPNAVDPEASLLADREVLPVTYLDTYSAVLPHLSHLAPRHEGIGASVDRLAQAIRVGGAALAGWERLAARADSWDQGKSATMLLSESEQSEALSLLAAPPAHLDSTLTARVRRFVEASEHHARNRRRRVRAIAVGVVATLGLVSVLAGLQSARAVVAARASVAAADDATARRLASEAEAIGGRDPDVPLVLAGIATSLSDDADVRNAVARIAGGQIPHMSIPLDYMPQRVVTSVSGRYAMNSSADAVIRIVDASGDEIAAIRYAEPDEEYYRSEISLSPEGERVAVSAARRTLQVLDIASGGRSELTGKWDPQTDTLLEWWDHDHLLVATTGGLDLINVDDGSRTAFIEAPDMGVVTGAKLSPSRLVIAITDGQRMQVWGLDDRVLRSSMTLPDITDLAVNDAGTAVFGARAVSLIRINLSDKVALTEYPSDNASTAVQALAGGYFVVGDERGRIAIYGEEMGGYPVVQLQAHLADPVMIATNGAALASVSFDSHLRLWDFTGLDLIGTFTRVGSANPGIVAVGALDMRALAATAFPEATLSHQVRATGPDSVVLSLVNRGSLIVSPSDVNETFEYIDLPQLGIPGRVLITQDGQNIIRVVYAESEMVFTAEIWRIDAQGMGWGPEPVTRFTLDAPVTYVGPGPFLAYVDGNGTIAVGTSSSLTVLNADGVQISSSLTYKHASPPLAVYIDDSGDAMVITQDGWLYHTTGRAVNLGALISANGGEDLAAAAFGNGQAWLLTLSGGIARYSASGLEMVAPAATVSGTGTLRVSTDGSRIAHVGAGAVSLIDASTGSVFARQSSPPGLPVDDVDFGGDSSTLYVVTAIGTVATWTMEENSALDQRITIPRALTSEEMVAYGITESVNG
jgi:WD40 repeat protein